MSTANEPVTSTDTSPGRTIHQRFAEALAEKFTRPRFRYDRKTGTERIDKSTPADRVHDAMTVHFVESDGIPAWSIPTCMEAAAVCADVRNAELVEARAEITRLRRLLREAQQ